MADNPYLDLDKPKETVEDSNPYLQTEDTGRNREQFGEGTVAREFVEGVGACDWRTIVRDVDALEACDMSTDAPPFIGSETFCCDVPALLPEI